MIGVFASQVRPQGQQEFTTVGANTFTVPQRVFSVSVLAVGGGGGSSGGGGSGGSGGAGGNLGYRNNYPVTPGGSLAVAVGAGGAVGGGAGGESAFATPALRVFGGLGASSATSGGVAGAAAIGATASFLGGVGGGASTASAGGGGGAAGYTGNGGAGGIGSANTNGDNGSGGGGGGGSYGGSSDAAGAGGGVGLIGMGAGGIGGVGAGANGQPGTGGSGGASGSSSPGSTDSPSTGGLYGGGGGGAELSGEQGPGAQGAVRVIWGYTETARREYHSTSTTFFFYNTASRWIASAANATVGPSFLTLEPTTTDPFISRTGLSIAGASNRYVHMTYRRTVAGTNPYLTGAGVGSDLFWSTSSRPVASESFKQSLPSYTWDGTSFITTTLDMHNPTVGGTDWATSTITELRVDFETSLVPYDVEAIEISNSSTPTYHLTKNV